MKAFVEQLTPFDRLHQQLLKEGFEVTVEYVDIGMNSYGFVYGETRNVILGFCEPNYGESYTYIDGKIAFDHEGCFDKWNKCPFNYPLPETDEQLDYIIEKLKFCGTNEGFKMSSEYDTKRWEDDYPEHLKVTGTTKPSKMKMKTHESNKLIAEFMGGIYKSKLFNIPDGSIWLPYWNMKKSKWLRYHSSWDWLMPVVEHISKILQEQKNFELYNKYLLEEGTNRKDFLIFRLSKKETYTVVVEFIKWYNKQQENESNR